MLSESVVRLGKTNPPLVLSKKRMRTLNLSIGQMYLYEYIFFDLKNLNKKAQYHFVRCEEVSVGSTVDLVTLVSKAART